MRHRVWAQMGSSLAHIRSIFADNETIAAGLKKFSLRLVAPATEKIGWEFAPDENFLTGQLRALLISIAGTAGHQKYAVCSVCMNARRAYVK